MTKLSVDGKEIDVPPEYTLLQACEAAGKEPSRERSLLGQCRRHAPPAMAFDVPDHARHYPAWVTTKREDWCGEHQHREG
jgi:hypothetical protein